MLLKYVEKQEKKHKWIKNYKHKNKFNLIISHFMFGNYNNPLIVNGGNDSTN